MLSLTEGDLITGAGNRSAIGTLVERASRFTILLHLPGGRHTAEAVRDALVQAMGQVPAQLRRSLTWDQGKEMALHAEIARALGMPVFFCDPHSPWQRPSNENTNGLRALRPPTYAHLSAADVALATRFATEHETIRPAIEQLRSAADELDLLPPDQAMTKARKAYRLLTEQIGPHEAAEEQVLYPALDRALGGHDATVTMSRGHAEIAHQIRRFGQLLADIGDQPPDEVDLTDLRALLYELHAILRLHTIQEDENYLSLSDEAASPYPSPPARQAAVQGGPDSREALR